MDAADVLSTIAGAALGIAGFSGILTAFMQRPGRLTTVEIYRVSVLLGVSFGCMFLALVPMLLEQFGVAGKALWSRASGVMTLYSLIAVGAMLVSSRVIARRSPEIFNRYLFSAITIGHVLNIGLQAMNVLRPDPDSASGVFVVGLLWYLVHSAVQFARMLVVQPAAQ